MKKNYSRAIALLSLAFLWAMTFGCGDTSEEYFTPNPATEQALGIDDDVERPEDPVIRLSVPSSSLYVGSRFEATIASHGWTIENVSWRVTGARLVSSGYNHSSTWEITSATTPVVVTAYITCRYNSIHHTFVTSAALRSKVLPAPRITGNTPSHPSQRTTYYITGLAQNHTYSWAANMYQYDATENTTRKSITLTFPGYGLYNLSCSVKDQSGTELITVHRSVDIIYQAVPPGGGDGRQPGDGDDEPGYPIEPIPAQPF